MIWLLLIFLACGDPAPEDTAPPPVDCEGLDEDACEEAEECWTVDGRPLHGDYSCEDSEKTYAGCGIVPETTDPSPTCADEVLYRAPPNDTEKCWQFGNDCIPDGWVECDPPVDCDG